MTATRRKTLFTARHDQQIKVYNDLLDGLKTAKKILPRFDGKVVTRKIADALKAEIDIHGLYFSIADGFLTISDHNNRSYKDPFSTHGCFYIDDCKVLIDIATRTEGKSERLDWAQTRLNLEETRQATLNNIIRWNTDLHDFDAEEQAYAQIEKLADAYRERFGYTIRRRIDLRN